MIKLISLPVEKREACPRDQKPQVDESPTQPDTRLSGPRPTPPLPQHLEDEGPCWGAARGRASCHPSQGVAGSVYRMMSVELGGKGP